MRARDHRPERARSVQGIPESDLASPGGFELFWAWTVAVRKQSEGPHGGSGLGQNMIIAVLRVLRLRRWQGI